MRLVEVEAEPADQAQRRRAGRAHRHLLAGDGVHARRGRVEKPAHGSLRDARYRVPGPDPESRPLRLVEQIPGPNLCRVAVVGEQGRDDVVQQMRAQIGMRDQPAAAPGLDAIDDASGPAQVEVEEHGHQRQIGPADQIERDVEVAPRFALDLEGRAVLAKPDARPPIAQEEPAQARDTGLPQLEKHVEHALLIAGRRRGRLQETRRWRRSRRRSGPTASWRQDRSSSSYRVRGGR